MMPKKTRKRRMTVKEALKVLQAEEAEGMVDMEAVTREALEKAEQEGIIFLDELDKIAALARARARCKPRGGTAGSAPDRRGKRGPDEIRYHQDRPHPVHRGGCLPQGKAST